MAAITVQTDSGLRLTIHKAPFVGIHKIPSAKRFKGFIRLETEREHFANRATRKPRAEDVGDGLFKPAVSGGRFAEGALGFAHHPGSRFERFGDRT
jgi:hypothetical protein